MIALFFGLYFTGRFIVEYWKDYQEWALCLGATCPETFVRGLDAIKSITNATLLTEGQLLSIIPALAGFAGLYVSYKRQIPAKWNVFKPPTDKEIDESDADKVDDGDEDVDDVLLDNSKPKK